MSNLCRKCGKEMHKDRKGYEQVCRKCKPIKNHRAMVEELLMKFASCSRGVVYDCNMAQAIEQLDLIYWDKYIPEDIRMQNDIKEELKEKRRNVDE